MGTNAKICKFVHEQHRDYIENQVDHVEWVRRRKVEIDREMFDEEKDGFPDGLVELIVTVCGIDAPGFPPMFGVGVQVVDIPGKDTLNADVFYYSAFEVGSKLSHEAMSQHQKFAENEQIVQPPSWLELPYDEEFDHEQMDQDAEAIAGDASGEEAEESGEEESEE